MVKTREEDFCNGGGYCWPYKKHDPIVNEPGPLRLNDKEAGASGRRKLCLVDWNNDGRLDLIVNTLNAAFLENVRQSGDTIYFKNQEIFPDFLWQDIQQVLLLLIGIRMVYMIYW